MIGRAASNRVDTVPLLPRPNLPCGEREGVGRRREHLHASSGEQAIERSHMKRGWQGGLAGGLGSGGHAGSRTGALRGPYAGVHTSARILARPGRSHAQDLHAFVLLVVVPRGVLGDHPAVLAVDLPSEIWMRYGRDMDEIWTRYGESRRLDE